MDLQQIATRIADAYEAPHTGRPSPIGDHETLLDFFKAIEDGNYTDTACDIAGISHESLRRWLKRADDGEEPYITFRAALKRISARAEGIEVQKVRKAGEDPRFWAASMTYLERRHPEKWGRRNESQDGPRVLVQIGVQTTDVQVSIASSSSSASPSLVPRNELDPVNHS